MQTTSIGGGVTMEDGGDEAVPFAEELLIDSWAQRLAMVYLLLLVVVAAFTAHPYFELGIKSWRQHDSYAFVVLLSGVPIGAFISGGFVRPIGLATLIHLVRGALLLIPYLFILHQISMVI